MNNFILGIFLMTITVLQACQSELVIPDSPFQVSNITLRKDTLARGFEIPFGLEVLSSEEYLLTDRIGKLFHYKKGYLVEIDGLPKVGTFRDPGISLVLHGGLMDIKVHPKYPDDPWIYISYLSLGFKTAISRFQIEGNKAIEMEKIYETSTSRFSGSNARIVWQDSSHFFLNIGASALSTVSDPSLISQELTEDWGKVHRLNDDGTIPSENPILPGFTSPRSIWSYGHRDATGLFYEKSRQILYSVEHGPKGGDEFNIIKKGQNYGWPLFSYGIDYSGAEVSLISEDSAAKISVLAEHHWTVPTGDGGQAIAPSFLWKVKSSNISEWNDKFLLSSLVYRRALLFNNDTKQTIGLPLEGRIRYMTQLPDGDFLALVEQTGLRKKNGLLDRIGQD